MFPILVQTGFKHSTSESQRHVWTRGKYFSLGSMFIQKKMVSRSNMLFVSKYLYSGRNNYSTDVKITGKSGFFSSL